MTCSPPPRLPGDLAEASPVVGITSLEGLRLQKAMENTHGQTWDPQLSNYNNL